MPTEPTSGPSRETRCELSTRTICFTSSSLSPLTSSWDTEESRPRKFYLTNADGERLAAELLADWKRLDAAIRGLDLGEKA